MNKKLATIALSGALLCTMGAPALAAGGLLSAPPAAESTGAERVQTLPSSQLYCGEIKAILTGTDGTVTGLHMQSEQSGEYVMKISADSWRPLRTGGGRAALCVSQLCLHPVPSSAVRRLCGGTQSA